VLAVASRPRNNQEEDTVSLNNGGRQAVVADWPERYLAANFG